MVGRAFWWSNCIQLRWMLWAMSHGGSLDNSDLGIDPGAAVDDFDWVMQARTLLSSQRPSFLCTLLEQDLFRKVRRAFHAGVTTCPEVAAAA